ncbi:hypothetical protein [Pseudomonas sp. GWSMS-1]|uniref:hypothetical protein n=1 Tax=Pseudomonas sp. GWSMS-1 TaxID=3308997 RepID=UPI003CF129FF
MYDKTNPLTLLSRGFALVRGVDGEIISSAQQARDALKLDLAFAMAMSLLQLRVTEN